MAISLSICIRGLRGLGLRAQELLYARSMSRDYRKLRVFHQADSLVMDMYKCTKYFPREEIYGLTAQLRRGAVSSAANIVEGCARRGEGEYLNFLTIAAASA